MVIPRRDGGIQAAVIGAAGIAAVVFVFNGRDSGAGSISVVCRQGPTSAAERERDLFPFLFPILVVISAILGALLVIIYATSRLIVQPLIEAIREVCQSANTVAAHLERASQRHLHPYQHPSQRQQSQQQQQQQQQPDIHSREEQELQCFVLDTHYDAISVPFVPATVIPNEDAHASAA